MQAIGLASRDTVPDSSFSASSEFNDFYKASNGRLNGTNAWSPNSNNNPNDYLQINLGYEFIICAVATQRNGRVGFVNEWTTKYKIQLSFEGTTFVTYQENNVDKVGIIQFMTRELFHYFAHFRVKKTPVVYMYGIVANRIIGVKCNTS